MDSIGNQVINYLDIEYYDIAAQMVSEFFKEMAEREGRNLAPDRETAIYYADLGLQAYATWINKPTHKKFKDRCLKTIEAGVDLYLQTGHAERMQIIEDMSNFQRQLKELIKPHFENAIDEYEIDGQRLDLYIPDLNLAIEADGVQHYQYCPAFHGSEADFKRQQWLDREKERKCKERGITLIRIRFDEEISMKTILSKVMNNQK